MVEQAWAKLDLLLQFLVKRLEEKQERQTESLQHGFAGFTKYYTASVWLGFDTEADGNNGGNANSGVSGNLFKTVLTPVHAGLEKKGWDRPSGITTATICKCSGLLATDECKNDPRGDRVYTEYFASGTAPSKYCSIHETAEVCKVSGKLAGPNCKEKETRVFITREDAESRNDWQKAQDAKYMKPFETCDTCTGATTPQEPEDPNTNPNDPNENTNTLDPGGNTNTGNTNTNTSGNTNTGDTNTNTSENTNTRNWCR